MSEIIYNLKPTKQEVLQYINKINDMKLVSFDIETTGLDFLKDKITHLGLTCVEKEAIVLGIDLIKEEEIFNELKKLFQRKEIKIAHNFSFEHKFHKKYGMEITGHKRFDTKIEHFLLDENSKHKLGILSERYTDMGKYKDEINYKKITEEPFEKVALLCARDVDCTLRLYNMFKQKLEDEDLLKLHDYIDIPAQYVLTEEAEYEGIRVDVEHLKKYKKELEEKLEDIDCRIIERPEVIKAEKIINSIKLDGGLIKSSGVLSKNSKKYKKFSLSSPKQLQVLLFEVSKLKPVRKIKMGYSTDAKTLKVLSRRSEICRLILQRRKISDTLSKYVTQIEEHLDGNNRVHTEYGLTNAVTARPISSKPNLQNIPRESNAGIKKMFIADKNCLLVSADYKQIEFRLWGNYANDENMLEDIINGIDIHSEVGYKIWPYKFKPPERVTEEYRAKVKGVVYGLIYGRGIKSLIEEFGLSEQEVIKIINWLFGKYPKSKKWLKNQELFVKKNKYVKNLFGRKRRLPNIDSVIEWERSEVIRQAYNTPIQSGVADLLKIAIVRVYNSMKKYKMKTRLVLSIHDANKYNTPINELGMALKVIKKGMCDKITGINFPLEVDFEIGQNWGEMIKLEEYKKDEKKHLKNWGFNL